MTPNTIWCNTLELQADFTLSKTEPVWLKPEGSVRKICTKGSVSLSQPFTVWYHVISHIHLAKEKPWCHCRKSTTRNSHLASV